MNIAGILSRSEGKTLELKRDLSSHRPVLRTVVAFSNTAGGRLVIGVADDRSVVGVPDARAVEERLASIVADGISPRVVPEIDIVSWRGLNLLVVEVHPGPSRPYHVIAEGEDAGTFVRIGSTNRRADQSLRAELARTTTTGSFDETPLPELNSEAIDFTAASESFAPVRRLKHSDLATLGLVTTVGRRQVPTVGGILLFGRERTRWFADAWVQVGRFKGRTKSHVLDSAEIDLPFPQAADAALAFVRRNIALRQSFTETRREETWEYPLVAIREAVINALVHSDYSQTGAPMRVAIYDDRIEIENSGILLPGMTLDDVYGGVSRLRNRVVGRVFRELGLVEQWGSGVGRMVESCRQAGLADPLIEEIGTRFRVTIFGEQVAAPEVDELDRRIIDALGSSSGGLSTSDVAEVISRSTRATRTRLKGLVEQGLVVEIHSGPNDPLKRYVIAEERARYGESR